MQDALKPAGDVRSIRALLSDYILRVDADAIIRSINRDPPRKTRAEVVGTPAVVHLGDQAAPFEVAFARARNSGEPQAYEVLAYGRSYAVWLLPAFEGGQFDGATLIATDTTALRRLVDELSASQEQTRAVMRALPDMLFLLDRDGVYLDFKTETVRDLATTPDAVVGNRIGNVLPPAVAQQCQDAIVAALDRNEMRVFEYRLELPHGVQDFEARVVASGRDQVVCIVRNMTDRKQLEQQLAAAERLVSLGTLVAGVAHEMNNPLSYLLLNLSSARKLLGAWADGLAPTAASLDDATNMLDKALEGGLRMQQIMQALTTFSHSRRDDVTSVDVPAVLDWALGMVEGQLGQRASVVRRYDAAPRAAANKDSLGQVFVNLLLNAAQALPDGPGAHEVTISARGERGLVVVEISDTGRGIEAADRPRVFEPFFTTKPVGVGTGLGLWICHGIVTGHGGSIDIDSVAGKGTTVRVTLPAAV